MASKPRNGPALCSQPGGGGVRHRGGNYQPRSETKGQGTRWWCCWEGVMSRLQEALSSKKTTLNNCLVS